eukprot:TRINITY_DN22254_c0_g1_i1.p2 TRINITY_DN22254_c0_g1~~TRINITY_DN22254_c0_g1_i1.p2  ORF type:complete len:236 (+),score=54.08 TRINITY_DN22254_c0_g1_i1:25-708(+)
MSLGWLTESSLIPKEPKPIAGVGTASLLKLQAAVYERERRGPGPSAKRRRAIAEKTARNDGVDARSARDEEHAEGPDASPAVVAAKLAAKVKRYEALAAGCADPGSSAARHEGALVDFERKCAEGAWADFEPRSMEALCGESHSSSSFPPAPPVPNAHSRPPSSAGRSIPMQPFERPQSTAEDLELREHITAETELAREGAGRERREAREAVRSRLAALRAAKAGQN